MKDLKQQYIHIPAPDTDYFKGQKPNVNQLKNEGEFVVSWDPVQESSCNTRTAGTSSSESPISAPLCIYLIVLSFCKLASPSWVHTSRNMAFGISQALSGTHP